MEVKVKVVKGQYHDSVSLMLAAREMKKMDGVIDAAIVMGTETNKNLLEQAGLMTALAEKASADDLIIVVKRKRNAEEVLDLSDIFLKKKKTSGPQGAEEPVHSIRSMAKDHPDINLAEISVAGVYAAKEAREALAHGMHVLLFSDNVSLENEIDLKQYAVSKGLLLMGPGAGTAFVNGVGIGFANALKKGPVGIVSAAGTGLQEVSSILASSGVGVSQAIGTGGRDLSQQVGGLMANASIEALIDDVNTDIIILISKPAHEKVTEKLLALLKRGKKESVICTLGAEFMIENDANLHFTATLEACALTAVRLAGGTARDYAGYLQEDLAKSEKEAKSIRAKLNANQRYIRGLYSGGTLCYEAQVIWRDMLKEPVYSNAPLLKKNYISDSRNTACHITLDLGEEEYTIGRPHPMIDNDLRMRYIEETSKEAGTAVIVMDVVIGYGAHPDPAEELGTAIHTAIKNAKESGWYVPIVVCVTGTADDPQGLENTKKKLQNAGAIVCDTNAQAARLAAMIVRGRQAVRK